MIFRQRCIVIVPKSKPKISLKSNHLFGGISSKEPKIESIDVLNASLKVTLSSSLKLKAK